MAVSFLGDGIMTIKFSNITISYNKHPAVHHLSGKFESGSLTAVIGPNGAGKTTLVKAIAGLIDINEGEMEKKEIIPSQIAYLPQQAEIEKGFPISLIDFVMFAFWNKVGVFRKTSRAMHAKAIDALDVVGLKGFEDRSLDTLSTGQFQRALFARTILQDTKVILLDEPFAYIDARTVSDLFSVIKRWHREKRTVIAVLHDVEQVKEYFPDSLLMARECIAWGRTKEILNSDNLMKAKKMMEAWDEHAKLCVK